VIFLSRVQSAQGERGISLVRELTKGTLRASHAAALVRVVIPYKEIAVPSKRRSLLMNRFLYLYGHRVSSVRSLSQTSLKCPETRRYSCCNGLSSTNESTTRIRRDVRVNARIRTNAFPSEKMIVRRTQRLAADASLHAEEGKRGRGKGDRRISRSRGGLRHCLEIVRTDSTVYKRHPSRPNNLRCVSATRVPLSQGR